MDYRSRTEDWSHIIDLFFRVVYEVQLSLILYFLDEAYLHYLCNIYCGSWSTQSVISYWRIIGQMELQNLINKPG
jgi:hypothetical protein